MLMLDVSSGDILPMIVLMPSKPREAKKVVMKTLVRNVVFCSWLIVPAGVKSISIAWSRVTKLLRPSTVLHCRSLLHMYRAAISL